MLCIFHLYSFIFHRIIFRLEEVLHSIALCTGISVFFFSKIPSVWNLSLSRLDSHQKKKQKTNDPCIVFLSPPFILPLTIASPSPTWQLAPTPPKINLTVFGTVCLNSTFPNTSNPPPLKKEHFWFTCVSVFLFNTNIYSHTHSYRCVCTHINVFKW